jgi:hypothetical protein
MDWTAQKFKLMNHLLYDPVLIGKAIEENPVLLADWWETLSSNDAPGVAYTYHEARQMDSVYRWMRNRLVHFGRLGSAKVLDQSYREYLVTFDERKMEELHE